MSIGKLRQVADDIVEFFALADPTPELASQETLRFL